MFAEPTRTPYDLQFSLGRIPVRVHPLFWLTTIILGSGSLGDSQQAMTELLLWIAVVFVSILVHELGHALAIQFFGWRPWITLYAMGGLASYEKGYSASYSSYSRKGNTPTGQIIISAAGPIAGFLLAGVVVAGLFVAGRKVFFPIVAWPVELGRGTAFGPDSYWVATFVWQMLWVNIYWGLVNLLPVYPLDGGQISRELFMSYSRRDGYRQSLFLSMVAAGGIAVYFAYYATRRDGGSLWPVLMFGILAYQSYQLLQQHRGGWGGKGW